MITDEQFNSLVDKVKDFIAKFFRHDHDGLNSPEIKTGVSSVSSANSDIGVATGTTTPSLTLNSGVGANQIVKLNGSAQLPAVDASLLLDLPIVYTTLVYSNTLQLSADNVETNSTGNNLKKKEIEILSFGTITVKYDIADPNGSYNTSGRTYVNGLAVGANNTASDIYPSFTTETDTIISVKPGDLVQLYIQSAAGQTAYCRNFRLYFDVYKSSVPGIININ